jgi:hypothetical protein
MFNQTASRINKFVVLLFAFVPALSLLVFFNVVRAGNFENEDGGVIYFDMALDEANGRIFGTDYSGNKIDVIDINTLSVVMTMPVGLQPAGIDLNPADNEFAVALAGQGNIKFYSLTTLIETGVITPAGTSGPNRPYDVLYGRPGRLYSSGNPGSNGFDYIHAIDTATKLEVGRSNEIMRAAPRLAMTADHNTLYVSQVIFSPQKIYRFDITTDIPDQTADAPHGPVNVNTLAVNPDGSKVYSSRGQVWNGDLNTLLGIYYSSQEIEYLAGYNRFYLSDTTNNQLIAHDGDVYLPIRYHPLAGTPGVARANAAETMMYVSTNAGVEVIDLTIPENPPTAVSVAGPMTGLLSTSYSFTATVDPPTTTVPVIYSWQATGQTDVSQSNLLSDTVSFAWLTTGPKMITVTATNATGEVVTGTHTITMTGPPIPDPVTYFDMVLDEPRQLIYGTDQDGDLIHVVDMNTLDVISSVPVGIGSGPTGLDISPSGDELAVALPEADEIAFVDLNTLLVTDSGDRAMTVCNKTARIAYRFSRSDRLDMQYFRCQAVDRY